ncbi:MAG: T9SS type A sorting domain-containing protein [Bacteroidetes bacterium]|nr:T9SS type A sorting domain-containing protein [Bacteroidota bacterium]
MKKISTLSFLIFLAFQTYLAQTTHYVSAGESIQTAIDAATNGDTIIVNDGTYTLSNRISLTKGITLKSANGNSSTTINGNGATKCIEISHVDAVVDGFTITNGYNPGGFGGGVNIISGGKLQNCFVTENQARDGGGVAIDNSGLVQNCIMYDNLASNNSGSGYGGGIRLLSGGTARNCLVYGNTSVGLGGGINIWNAGNIESCTVVDNTAPNGAGVRCRSNSNMVNSIVYFNNGNNWVTDGTSYSFSNNCTTPELPNGAGNITSDPQFVNAGSFDYRILNTSPVIDGGLNQSWMAAGFDLDDNIRIFNSIVDIGAYEYFMPEPEIPTLMSPLNLTVAVSIEAELDWETVANAATYTLEVATDEFFTNIIYSNSTLANSSFTITGLLNTTDYYWHVSAENSTGSSGFSAGYKFTTITSAIPVLTWPVYGAIVASTSTNLGWYTINGGPGLVYDILYSEHTDMTSPQIITDVPGSPYLLTGLTGGKPYYWQVRSKSSSGAISAYSSIETFTTQPSVVVPYPSWPVWDATVYTYSPTLYWYLGQSGDNLNYEVEYVEGDATDLTNSPNITNIQNMYTTLSGLHGGKHYVWQVRSTDGETTSDWSTPASFYTVAPAAGAVVPIPSWPISNTTVYNDAPGLFWYLGTSGVGLSYEVEWVEGDVDELTNNPTILDIHSLFVYLSELENGEQYSWQVRSFDGEHYSNWSTPQSFYVYGGATAPITPYPSWPIGGTNVYSSSTSLNWYIGTYAPGLKYEVEYGIGSFTHSEENINTLNTTITNLTAGELYQWRVRSTDGTTPSEWSETQTFNTIENTTYSSVTYQSWPIGGVTVWTNSPTLYWYSSNPSQIVSYEVKYSSNASMQNAVTVPGITGTSTTITGLTSGATYYWSVSSYDGSVHSAHTTPQSFSTSAGNLSVVPMAGSPVAGVMIETTSPTLSWYIPTEAEELIYEVEIAHESNFADASHKEVQSQSEVMNNLSPGTYYWRVRSKSIGGNYSAYSTPENFTINSVTSAQNENQLPVEYELKQNYPNPFNPATVIEFSVPNAGFYSLNVYNIIGEKVATVIENNFNAGNFQVTFNASRLSSGIYIYQLRGNNILLTKKMLLMK